MPKRSRRTVVEDFNETAIRILAQATGQEPLKNPAAVALGKLGGKKGGPARAAALSPKRRSAIAKKAALSRWGKRV